MIAHSCVWYASTHTHTHILFKSHFFQTRFHNKGFSRSTLKLWNINTFGHCVGGRWIHLFSFSQKYYFIFNLIGYLIGYRNYRFNTSKSEVFIFSVWNWNIQVYGRNRESCCSSVWTMRVKPHFYICWRTIDWPNTFPHCIRVSECTFYQLCCVHILYFI